MGSASTLGHAVVASQRPSGSEHRLGSPALEGQGTQKREGSDASQGCGSCPAPPTWLSGTAVTRPEHAESQGPRTCQLSPVPLSTLHRPGLGLGFLPHRERQGPRDQPRCSPQVQGYTEPTLSAGLCWRWASALETAPPRGAPQPGHRVLSQGPAAGRALRQGDGPPRDTAGGASAGKHPQCGQALGLEV